MEKHIQMVSDWMAEMRAYCQDYDRRSPCIRKPLTQSCDSKAYDPRSVPTTIGPVYILFTHVCISHTNDMDEDESTEPSSSVFFMNESLEWKNGLPTAQVYDPRSVPSLIGDVSIGQYYVMVFPADVRTVRPLYVHYRDAGWKVVYHMVMDDE